MSSESSSDKNQKDNTDLPLKKCNTTNDGSLEQPTVSCLYATAVTNKYEPVESNTIKTIGTSSSPIVSDTGAIKTVLGYELLQSEEHSDTKLVPSEIKNENDYHDSHTDGSSEKIAEQLLNNEQNEENKIENFHDKQSPNDEKQQHQQDYNLLNDDYQDDLDDNNGYSETIAKNNNFDKNGIPPPPGEPKPENKARLRRYRLNME